MMDAIEQLFKKAIEDQVFTREERRAIIRALAEEELDPKELGKLKHEVFQMAEKEMDNHQGERIVEWLRQAVKVLNKADKPLYAHQVYFSPGAACLKAICDHVQQARKQIDICYLLTDLLKELSEKRDPFVGEMAISDALSDSSKLLPRELSQHFFKL
ncbi:MAG: hypothetical protein AAFR59_08780 [Bacteroidota bacterium]